MRTWWSSRRNRWIALVTGVLLVVVWTVAIVLASRGGGPSRRRVGTLTLRDARSPGSPDALWLFGFDTLRLDPDEPTTVERLGVPAFGDVAGTVGGVLLHEPGNGRFGFLDATRNRIVDEVSLPAAPAPAASGGTVAGTPTDAWVVTAPGRLLRHSVSGAPDVSIDVAPGIATGAAATTRVTAGDRGAWAVTTTSSSSGATAVVTRVEGSPPAVARTVVVAVHGTQLVDALAARGSLWLVTPDTAIALDGATLREEQRVPLGDRTVLAAAVTDTTLAYVNAAGQLGRIELATGRNLGVARRFDLTVGRPFVHLAASHSSLWALVGTNRNGAFQSELVRFDSRARPVLHLGLPASLAIADLALSRAPAST